MMRNILPKIILGVVLVLLALHFTVSNVTIVRQDGRWPRPDFSFSFGKTQAPPEPTSLSDVKDEFAAPPSPQETTTIESVSETTSTEIATTTIDISTSIADATSTFSTETIEATTTHQTSAVHHAAPTHSVDPHANHGDESMLPCSELPGAQDVVFVIKTGATEVDERMPVHFNTTLRCFPKALVFSDFGEDYQGHIIHDALGNIIDQIKLNHDDFDLWRRLKSGGRASLDPSELSINDHGSNLGGGGNPNNGGWRLDKFKNIPMVNYTINRYPEAKWFIYTDADTYIMWSNLLKWVSKMDEKKLLYFGSPAVIDDQVFGHGGSGYIVSNALMHKAADAYNSNQAEWDEYAASHWAGDCVLATLLERLGAPLTWAYPMIQGGDNNVMDYYETGYDRRLWCYPAISYHHIPPHTVNSLWHFEQEWIDKYPDKEIRHGDVYKVWYLPQLSEEREDWDSMSEDEMTGHTINNSWDCRDLCKANSTCLQWTYKETKCSLYQKTKLGKAASGVQSGWNLERINAKVKQLEKCDEGDWILPDRKERVKRTRLAIAAANKYR